MTMRFLALLCALCLFGGAFAGPLDRSDVPEPLRTWVPWVLHGNDPLACPPAWNDAQLRSCVWPSSLELILDAGGGRFRFRVSSFSAAMPVVLPGQEGAWPLDVESAGRGVPVVEREGRPVAWLSPGEHLITGRFTWRSVPASLALPADTGLLSAEFGGRAITPDNEGRLWLRSDKSDAQGHDSLSVRVFRHVDDAIPLEMTTLLELAISGKPRELALPLTLLPGFVPLALESPLPARLEKDGKLHLQVRAGNWTVSVQGRRMDQAGSLSLPQGGPSPEEVWSFQARNDLRLVTPSGVASVDPRQAGVPSAWGAWPAFRMRPGETLKLSASRRGDPDPAPDRLTLQRMLWLDFDGGGYSFRDRIGGSLSRSFRLEAPPPLLLGRVEVDGEDRYITRLVKDGATGVEVRSGVARVVADGRISGAVGGLPATGWQADFSSVSAVLNLPPGWRLIHASGVDQAQGSWVSAWTLWDFFFVLLLTVAALKLAGRVTALVLGLALTLSWHLPGAPQWAWLLLMATAALGHVTGEGKLALAVRWGRRLALAVLVVQLLPFAVSQVRQAIYPSLEWLGAAPQGGEMPSLVADGVEQAEKAKALESLRAAMSKKSLEESAPSAPAPMTRDGAVPLQQLDVGARIQTGPGLPDWVWQRHVLGWQGPVERGQEIGLWLEPPMLTRFMSFAMLALLAAALWRLAGFRFAALRPGVAQGMLVLALCLGGTGSPGTAQAGAPERSQGPAASPLPEAPPQALLEELKQKLTQAEDCQPACASLDRLLVSARGGRIALRAEVSAVGNVMLPLPGAGAQWRAERVLLDGQVPALRRDQDGMLWVKTSAGRHQILLEGEAGEGGAVQIALPLAPKQVETDLAGWSLSGVDARGQVSGALTLNRHTAMTGAAARPDARDALPPFLRVVRTLHLGVTWTLDTRIERAGPSRAPVVVRVPLLAGEAVTDGAVAVVESGEGPVVSLTLAAGEGAQFSSRLPQTSPIHFRSSGDANQIEVWRLDASPIWHADFSGIPPVQRLEENRWMPQWQPWPGESMDVRVQKPLGVEGQTLTLDQSNMVVRPGKRATDVELDLKLRSSQGGNHKLTLPEGAQLLSVAIDGQVQPIRAEGRSLTLPVRPGEQSIHLAWREPRGMGLLYRTSELDANLAGANARIHLNLPRDRWLLFLGGPPLGPAVLFWGMALVIAALAVALGRSRLTPLSTLAWLSLGLGAAQASLEDAVLVASFLLLMAARGRWGERLSRRWFNIAQVGLALLALGAVGTLFDAIHTGLLGRPEMLVEGNGSSAFDLHWYLDRSAGLLPTAWVISLPLFGWRLLMLAWALWLASGVVVWARWVWQMFSLGGTWKPALPGVPGEKSGESFLARRRREAKEKAESSSAAEPDGNESE